MLPAEDDAHICSELDRLQRPYSQDVVNVYRVTGGMEDFCDDDQAMFSLWSLSRLVRETLESDCPGIPFADFLICSHLYAYKYEDDFRSSVYVYHGPGILEEVAPSIADFFEKYLTKSDDLLLLWDLE